MRRRLRHRVALKALVERLNRTEAERALIIAMAQILVTFRPELNELIDAVTQGDAPNDDTQG